MPRLRYVSKKFKADHLAVIEQANAILAELRAQGFTPTLRGLYYQFVARGFIPNTQQSYKRLGSILNDARLAGMVDWSFMVDMTRELEALAHWRDPQHIIDIVAAQFRTERWAGQPLRVEVWIEKDAMAGIIRPVCERNDVPYLSCRGYTSQSELWASARRLLGYMKKGQRVVVLHLGDHDPSGIDMTRDIRERLELFTVNDWYRDVMAPAGREGENFGDIVDDMEAHGTGLEVRRIALTMDQIEELSPPPNPAKITDSRADAYIAEYGYESWELDALPPAYVDDLIQDHLDGLLDADAWDGATEAMDRHRELLAAAAERWDEVVELLEGEA